MCFFFYIVVDKVCLFGWGGVWVCNADSVLVAAVAALPALFGDGERKTVDVGGRFASTLVVGTLEVFEGVDVSKAAPARFRATPGCIERAPAWIGADGLHAQSVCALSRETRRGPARPAHLPVALVQVAAPVSGGAEPIHIRSRLPVVCPRVHVTFALGLGVPRKRRNRVKKKKAIRLHGLVGWAGWQELAIFFFFFFQHEPCAITGAPAHAATHGWRNVRARPVDGSRPHTGSGFAGHRHTCSLTWHVMRFRPLGQQPSTSSPHTTLPSDSCVQLSTYTPPSMTVGP